MECLLPEQLQQLYLCIKREEVRGWDARLKVWALSLQ